MSLSAGERLGPYEVRAPVAAGGMGEVYRARDPRLDRDVAIKVLPERLSADPQALARFGREAKAVAALSHPNILAIFDVGNDRGIAYVVTELLEGETLRACLRRGQLSWRKAVEIAAAIADGLGAVHRKGIVHRDLKPENIFLTSDGPVKVLDFGLARWQPPNAAPGDTSAPTETDAGTVMGTVGYMSPEQVRGVAADAPSDLFSLGCVLYEMISGRRAFSRETAAQTMTDILERQPPPLAEIAPPVPKELDRLVSLCLEKDAAARSYSALDLSVALKDVLNAPARLGVARPESRYKLTVAAVVVVAALLLAGGAYWLRRAAPPADSIAVLPFVNAGGNPEMDYLSDGITESLINALSQVPNLAVMSRNSVFRLKGRDPDAQKAGEALKVQAVLTGTVARRGDSLTVSAELVSVRDNRHLWGEQFNRKLADILAVQEEISSEISDKLRLRLSGEDRKRVTRRYTGNTEAYQLYLQGRYYWNKKTAEGFNKAVEYFQQTIQKDPNYAPAYAALANLYYNMANYNFALIAPEEAWAKAKAAASRAVQIDDTLAPAHASLALIAYQWEWDWPAAEKEFKRALALDPGSSSTYEPTPSSTNHWYSHFLMSLGRTEEAIRVGRRALELDPVDLAINAHQGWYYVWRQDFQQAFPPLRKTIEMAPTFSVAQWYLGFAYERQGNYPAAVTQFENAVRLTGGFPSMTALLGHAYAAGNKKAEAQAVLRQLNDLSKTRYVPSYPVATIYAALGQKEEAFVSLEKAYDTRDAWMDYLAIDPRFDNLRPDPRFASLLRRLKLGQ